MKVAYLGKIQLSDTDLPLLHETQKMADITYLMEVNPRFMKGPAYNIQQIYPKTGIFKATEAYPEFSRLKDFIDLDKFYVINTCGKLWQLKSFWTYLLLLMFLLRRHFDVLHLVWPPNLYEFPVYSLRKRMVLTVHDPFPHSGLDSKIVRFRRFVAFHLIPRFILLNKAQQQDFTAYYHIAPERVISSGMSCCSYLLTVDADMAKAPKEGTYILFEGKISPYKGLDNLLPAMKRVHEECPDCRLVVAGGGKYHFDISEYQGLDYIDIRNRFIPDTELVALIKNCAFMVCPYTDATQSGVIMSAFAFCKPVIATNVGGLPEMVSHNRHGLIIKEKDVEALAASMVTLWKEEPLQKQFAEGIAEDYNGDGNRSWRHIAEKLCHEVYKP